MKLKDLVLIGSGGLAREVLWHLNNENKQTRQYNIIGFVDNVPALKDKTVNGYPVLGNDQWLLDYEKEVCAAICIGDPNVRRSVYDKYRGKRNISFPVITADDASYSETVHFGQGCIVCPSSALTVNITIGEFVIIDLHCTVSHDSVIDDFATLHPGVNIAGNVHIGACADIGIGTSIIQGRSIGENTVIGAGSVIVKDIPANCTAVGVPAVPINTH